jgi:hypothetical protein
MRSIYLLLALLPLTLGAVPPGAASEEFFLPESSSTSSEFQGAQDALAGGKRAGKPFTRTGKVLVKEKNAEKNEGKNRCENCGTETVPAKKHEKNVTPPSNEAHVDHVIPKAKGGPGEPDNGQVLCRECNLEKGDKMPVKTPEKTP